ncbi:MAG TPA: 2OG-Fe(II) oxygenase [Polyangiaceae bacterium]|nr:2OG-Fe(II) oxygenase [Polyangiaceae bacterium]
MTPASVFASGLVAALVAAAAVRLRALLAGDCGRWHGPHALVRAVRAPFVGMYEGAASWFRAVAAVAGGAFLAVSSFELAGRGARAVPPALDVARALVMAATFVAAAGAARRRGPPVPRLERWLVAAASVIGLVVGPLARALGGFSGELPPSFAEASATGALVVLSFAGRLFDPIGHWVLAFAGDAGPRSSAPLPEPSAELRARTGELAERFRRDGRLVVERALPEDVAIAVATALSRLETARTENSSYGARLSERVFVPHPDCRGPCGPACRFAESLARGPFRSWLREVTGRSRLVTRSSATLGPLAAVHAFGSGDHLGPHRDAESGEHDRAAIVCVWHANATWDSAWGGALRFLREEDGHAVATLPPRFDELHVFRVPALHDVTPVTGPETRRTLNVRLYEPLAGTVD